MFYETIKSKGFTYTSLAKEIGVSKSCISKICSNKRKEIKLTTAIKLSDALGITIRELIEMLGGEDADSQDH